MSRDVPRPTSSAATNQQWRAGLVLLSSELSLSLVLERIIELGMDITAAKYGALGVVGMDGRLERFIVKGLTKAEEKAIGAYPVGRGLLGALIHEPEILRLDRIADDPRSYGFPPNHPPMTSFLGAPVRARGRVYGNLYLTEKQGASAFTEDDEHEVEALGALAGAAIDNARLHEETRRSERLLTSLRTVTQAILDGQPRTDVLQQIAVQAHDLAQADVAFVSVPTRSLDRMTVEAAAGERGEGLLRHTFRASGSLPGAAFERHGIVIVASFDASPNGEEPLALAGGIGPAASVPMLVGGRPVGVLSIGRARRDDTFDQETIELLETFASQATLALESLDSQERLQQLRVMDDRERIAKDLHDGAIQSLFGVGLHLQTAAGRSSDPGLRERLEYAVGEIDNVILELRHYIFGLRPSGLLDESLGALVSKLGDELQERSGVVTVTQFDSGLEDDLRPIDEQVVHIVREALSNVGRHSAAQTCRVVVERRGESAVIEVGDDGKGFDPSSSHAGSGLRNLRSRASAMGGAVEIDSSRSEGTTVRVFIPIVPDVLNP